MQPLEVKVWVGFDEYGGYAGMDPYIRDEVRRNLVKRLARAKAVRNLGHATRSGDT